MTFRSISSISKQIFSGGTPSTKVDSYWNGSFPWLSSGETSNRYIYSTKKSITQQGIDNSSTRLASKNTIIIASAGQGHTRGQTSMLMIDTYINQSIIAIDVDLNVANPYYVFYNLSGRYDELRTISDGTSSRGSLTTKLIGELKINLPSLKIQNQIVDIIQPIDEKIITNGRVNDNLLNSAKCAFRKMMECSTKRDGSLSEVANITMGQSPPGESLSTTDGKLFFQGRAEFGTIYPTPRLYTTHPKRIAPKGSVLVCVRAPVGDINLALEECCIGRGLAAIVSKHGSQGYIHYLMDYLRPQLDTFNNDGTVFGSINKDSINDLPISIPDKSIIMKFDEYATVIDKQIEINHLETLKLIELRDYLLPKLMNGEIDAITERCVHK